MFSFRVFCAKNNFRVEAMEYEENEDGGGYVMFRVQLMAVKR